MRQESITTNEWHDATQKKPWVKRMVLVRTADNAFDVAYFNGMYWCTQGGRPYHKDGDYITHFYIFERLTPKSFDP